jgi:uncharacterized RDD family membrane protein YckC
MQLASYLLLGLICWRYFAAAESSERQATFGKRVMGLRVVDTDGERIDRSTATWRWVFKALSGLPLGAGFVMAGLTRNKQALHDRLLGTVVVKTSHATSTSSDGTFDRT